jgi:Mg-chelatase subunit ChlD
VLFVLDLSGSMNFSMIPRDNPTDEPGRGYDMPRDGELSRLQEAKASLMKALRSLEDGAVFNLVLYASDVWTWQDELVTMSTETRTEVAAFVDALEAVGGTNIYGALQTALELAGARGGDAWSEPLVDTIYFLSDGRPSVGVTTSADEILAFVREQNATAGIVVHTIGLSGAQDPYLLRALAEQNGGTYVAR